MSNLKFADEMEFIQKAPLPAVRRFLHHCAQVEVSRNFKNLPRRVRRLLVKELAGKWLMEFRLQWIK